MYSVTARRTFGLAVCLVILLACQLAPVSKQQSGTKIQSITANGPVSSSVVKIENFDHCSSVDAFNARVIFHPDGDRSNDQGLIFTSANANAQLPVQVRADLEAALQEKFAQARKENGDSTGGVEIDVPAHTWKEYTITWNETRQNGTITYTADGQTQSVDYSFRTGLEILSANSRDVGCSTPTATPENFIPQSTNPPQAKTMAEGCISAATWTPESTDPALLAAPPQDPNGCYNLEGLGLLNGQPNLHIRTQTENTTLTSGIYTPVSPTSVIEFKIFVNSLYETYDEIPPEITFAITPAGDRLTAKSSARFKLHVEDTGSKPRIHFMLADAGENTGVILGSQHYEYGNMYTIRLELKGNQMDVFINDLKLKESLILPDGEKSFYVGYSLPTYSGADVEISDITIDGAQK